VEPDEERVGGLDVGGVEGAVRHDARELFRRPQERRDRVTEPPLEVRRDLALERGHAPRRRLEDDVAAGDDRLDAGAAQLLEVLPQGRHRNGVPADVDGSQKRDEGRHPG
jgi:hypothetical protein